MTGRIGVYFPIYFAWLEINTTGRIVAAVLGVMGIAAEATRRRGTWWRPAWIGWHCAVVCAAYALTVAILAIDPRRDTGTVPLPWPLDTAATATILYLYIASPAVCGLLLGALAKAGPGAVRGRAWVLALLSIVGLWIAPWSLGVLVD